MKGIYKITCVITNVVYIGSTTVSFVKRWKKHKQRLRNNYHENSYLQSTWNKYGSDSFSFEVLESMNSKKNSDIRAREEYWLSKYFILGRDYCFNMTDRSCGGNMVKSQESKLKLSESIKRSYTPELRKIRSKQAIERNSVQKMHDTKGTKRWKDSHKKAMRKLAKNKGWLKSMKEANRHRQVMVETDRGEVFESVSEAARITGACNSNIRLCIRGKIQTSMGRKWFYSKP